MILFISQISFSSAGVKSGFAIDNYSTNKPTNFYLTWCFFEHNASFVFRYISTMPASC